MDASPTRLRLAFVPGVTPDKWARVWRDRHGADHPLDLAPIEEAAQRDVLFDGTADLCLGRLPEDGTEVVGDDLHCVVLYAEVPVVVAERDHFVAAADEVSLADLAEEQLVRPHPSGWTPDAPQRDFLPMTARQAVEVAASGSGIVILPMSVARLHHRRDVVQVPVTDLPPSRIALIWRKDADSALHQDFVGVTRGRGARSSR